MSIVVFARAAGAPALHPGPSPLENERAGIATMATSAAGDEPAYHGAASVSAHLSLAGRFLPARLTPIRRRAAPPDPVAQRRGRDSNPRTRFPPSRDFQSRPFNRSGTSPGL